ADCGEEKVWSPGRQPGRNSISFAQSEEQMGQKVHQEDQPNSSRDARQKPGAREPDPERGGQKDDDQTSPGQCDSVLQMSGKWSEQTVGEIEVESKIVPQLRKTQKFRAHVC